MIKILGFAFAVLYVVMLFAFPVWDGRHLFILGVSITLLLVAYFQEGHYEI